VIRLEVDALRSETSFMEKIEIVSEKEWSNTMVVARSQKLTWWPCGRLRVHAGWSRGKQHSRQNEMGPVPNFQAHTYVSICSAAFQCLFS
jgi:hypothetical protein